MDIEKRIKVLSDLGKWIDELSEGTIADLKAQAKNENNWFTDENIQLGIDGTLDYLKESKLRSWLSKYDLKDVNALKIGIVMAGNIPMVGFHDLLCVLLSGHHAMIKLSSQDAFLMKWLLSGLQQVSPELFNRVELVDRLNSADAYIATGSDNTARYFSYYFGEKPHIIRQNRTSVAVIKGDEVPEDLSALGKDIFTYFGLGCRNVAKLLVPLDYSFNQFFEAIQNFESKINHHKYQNNYDYNKSIYLVNKQPHLDNGFLLVTKSKELVSPISVIYFEEYTDEKHLNVILSDNAGKIQCIVGGTDSDFIPFGSAQHPELWDYADGVDTMEFLLSL